MVRKSNNTYCGKYKFRLFKHRLCQSIFIFCEKGKWASLQWKSLAWRTKNFTRWADDADCKRKVKLKISLIVWIQPPPPSSSPTYPVGVTHFLLVILIENVECKGMGKYFVTLAKDCGYERTILQLGRGLRDFFLNLDNLHDYLKYSFPKMKAPSFFVDSETADELMLQYRTRRRGFHYYVQGQVR